MTLRRRTTFWPVYGVAGALALTLLLTSGRYGYFGDELYFWAAGQHLDWSYADQPPLVPLLARAMDLLVPGSLAAMRLPALACAVAGVLLAAATVRELGGSRRAELLAAAAVAGSPTLAAGGHVLTTTPVDSVLWITVTWLLVRWLRLRDDRLLLWSGLVTGVALQAKYTMVFFWLAAGVALLAFGPRDLLRRRLFWVGAAVAVLGCVPALLWQWRNGWPQLGMTAVLAQQQGPAGFAALLLGSAGVLGTPLLCYGVWRSLRSPLCRFPGVTFLGLLALFALSFGDGYNLAGLFPVLWAIGATGLDQVRGRWLPWLAWPLALLSTVTVLTVLPVRPAESVAGSRAGQDFVNVESIGWPELADTVAAAYRTLEPETRRRTTLVADHYWTAGALARYGPERGLPAVFSPHRGFWYFGTPPRDADVTLYVGGSQAELARHFGDVRQVATVDSRRGTPVWLCQGQREPWPALWQRLRRL